jgi:hypothetical protein
MSGNIDILKRLPDVAALGRMKLQDYCNEWLQRPIARKFGISHLIVGADLMLTVNLDLQRANVAGTRTFIPICELLDYVIDRHFQEPAKRQELHAAARDIRQRWGEVGYQYEAMAGRVGNLCLTCKNPACGVSIETAQQAVEGQRVHMSLKQATCPACGHTATYDGNDLKLLFADQ